MSYKFFANKACKYYPCHKTADRDNFNCIFCYCPLYALGSECGGNFKYVNGIKDCSNCTLPHEEGGYERVMEKIELLQKLANK